MFIRMFKAFNQEFFLLAIHICLRIYLKICGKNINLNLCKWTKSRLINFWTFIYVKSYLINLIFRSISLKTKPLLWRCLLKDRNLVLVDPSRSISYSLLRIFSKFYIYSLPSLNDLNIGYKGSSCSRATEEGNFLFFI